MKPDVSNPQEISTREENSLKASQPDALASSSHPQDPTAVMTAVTKLVEILKAFSPTDRERVITAALMMFGESFKPRVGGQSDRDKGGAAALETDVNPSGISAKAGAWMRSRSVTPAELDHSFSVDGGNVDVIAAKMPGETKRTQTVEAYLLCGLRTFLATGEVTFSDKDARALCETAGCYDYKNHAKYLKSLGNKISGSVSAGWKITNPGLTEAARIVKEVAAPANA